MNIVGAVIIFILVWWCVFFAVLPMGVKGRWEDEDDGVEGAEPGAPTSPEMKKKLILTTKISFFIWIAICLFILSGIVDFRD